MMPIHLLNIVKNNHMAGMKKAVVQGNTLYLSPAMLSLLGGLEGKELEEMLSKIPIIEIPEFDPSKMMEMEITTKPPEKPQWPVT